MTTLIIGCDPGLRKTGMALIECSSSVRRVVRAWTLTDPSPLEVFIELDRCGAELLALELYTYQGERSQNRHALDLARFVGAVEAHWTHSQIEEIVGLSKLQVNRSLGLRGKQPKSAVRRAVEALFRGYKAKNEHEADAVAVAFAGWIKWRNA